MNCGGYSGSAGAFIESLIRTAILRTRERETFGVPVASTTRRVVLRDRDCNVARLRDWSMARQVAKPETEPRSRSAGPDAGDEHARPAHVHPWLHVRAGLVSLRQQSSGNL